MFFSISVWLLFIFALGSIAAGYGVTHLWGSVTIGILMGLATFILLLAGSFIVALFFAAAATSACSGRGAVRGLGASAACFSVKFKVSRTLGHPGNTKHEL